MRNLDVPEDHAVALFEQHLDGEASAMCDLAVFEFDLTTCVRATDVGEWHGR